MQASDCWGEGDGGQAMSQAAHASDCEGGRRIGAGI